ncbi:MAG TPA: aminopeptidase N, partial [Rhizomicrobium sp.]|nr:aminopeptidase N [Rhizomicrobium sp.]
MRTDEPRAIKLSEYVPPQYQVHSIALDFQLDPEKTIVKATSKIEKTGNGPMVLNGEQLKLLSIKIDGKALLPDDYSVADDLLTVANTPENFTLEITTEISPATNTTLNGLYTASGIFCTQCEAEGFRRITWFFDRPDYLTVYTTRIEADKAKYPVLLSNGNLTGSGDLANGRHFAVWNDPFKKPCYLFALVAGDLGVLKDTYVRGSGRPVDLAIYVEHGNESKVTYAMDSLKRAMRWDEEKYGLEYDLDIFMIVAVSAFNFGAMENKGLNIFNDKLLLASPETATDDDYARIESVVAHEYFHNWTGDRITCRDWFQLSLKEGLTVFRDQSFSGDMRSEGVKRIEDVKMLRMRQFVEDSGPLAHPVQPQAYITIDNFYTATIYEKGSEVIRMLKTLVGDEGYRKATDLYFQRHDGQAATVEDWVNCFEDANGRDLAQFRRWYAQAGTPTIETTGDYDANEKSFALTITQSLAPTPGQPVKEPMHIPVKLGFIGQNGNPMPLTLKGEKTTGPEERVLELTKASETFHFIDVAQKPLVSVGRGFSAPANFVTGLGPDELAFQMQSDQDDFNRWEAAQKLSAKILLDSARNGGKLAGEKPYVEALGAVLAEAEKDPAYAAYMMLPPIDTELALQMSPPDPDGIFAARIALIRAVAAAHGARIKQLYDMMGTPGAFDPGAGPAGRRALRNACLRYLTAADDEAAATLADAHYRAATNMTDSIAGLAALTRMESAKKQAAFDHFHDRFKNDPLVLDKWMALQAGSCLPGTVAEVKRLMTNPAFSLKNPNRVRSLIGAFA